MKKLIFLILFFILCYSNPCIAAQLLSNCYSTEGTEFYVAFKPCAGIDSEVIKLFATSRYNATITISNPRMDWSTSIPINANRTNDIIIPNTYGFTSDSDYETILDKGLKVTSTAPISLFASNASEGSSRSWDAANILPIDILSSRYIIQTLAPTNPGKSDFALLATEDSTIVDLYLTASTSGGHQAGVPYQVVLNKCQLFMLSTFTQNDDFSGTLIDAHGKKLAVFYGASGTRIPADVKAADHLYEQAIPIEKWGTKFAITGTAERQRDKVKVTAISSGTRVDVNGAHVVTLKARQSYEFELEDPQTSCFIESSKPVLCNLFLTSHSVNNANRSNYGDPAMVTIYPVEQTIDEITFSTVSTSQACDHFVNIVTKTYNTNNITLDGVNISSSFLPLSGNSEYSFARQAVSEGSHTIHSSSGIGFLGHAYGMARLESYAYNLGTRLCDIVDYHLDDDTTRLTIYEGEIVNWKGLSPSKAGIYQVSQKSQVTGFDSLSILDLTVNPILHGDTTASFCQGKSFTWLGNTYDTTGEYQNTFSSVVTGCDSIVTLHLTKIPYPDNVEIVNCSTSIENNVWNIQASYSSDTIMSPLIIPLVGDINDDGDPEIICFAANDAYKFHGANKIFIVEGNSHQIIDQIYLEGVVSTQSAGIYGIVKLPNRHTILVTATIDKKILAYDLSSDHTHSIWSQNIPYSMVNINFADFNNDGFPELYCGNYIFDVETGNLLTHGGNNSGKSYAHINKASLKLEEDDFLHAPYAADMDHDGFLELVAGNEIYKVKITNRTGETGNSISLFKSIAPPVDVPSDGHTQVADFNLDGYLDVLISNKPLSNNTNVYYYVWDVHNNKNSKPIIIPNKKSTQRGKSFPLIADINADGELEIIIQSDTYSADDKVQAYKYNIATNDFTHLWNLLVDEDSYSNTMSAFDFNHDGINELILTDQTTIKILNGSGKSHLTGNDTTNIYAMSSFSFGECTIMQYPVVVDVDKDGSADIIAIGRYGSGHTYKGSLNIFTSAGKPWAPARSVWNQYMYNVFNINQDLTIPTYHYNNAKSFVDPDDPTIIRRPYNNFFQQSTTIDQYGRYVNKAADIVVSSVAEEHSCTQLNIATIYCNLGERDILAPYYITTYADSYRGRVLAVDTIWQPLRIGDCVQPTTKLPTSILLQELPINKFVIAVNDGKDGIAQYGNQQAECDTTNNMIEVTIPKIDCDTTRINLAICEGDMPYTHPETGIVFPADFASGKDSCVTFTNVFGGDSVIQVILTINPIFHNEIVSSICQGEIFTWGKNSYSSSGIYKQTFQSFVTGCDSVVTLNLTVYPTAQTTITDTILSGQTYEWNNTSYTETGTYKQTLQTSNQCDSIVTLNLYKNTISYDIQSYIHCADDPYIEFEVNASKGIIHQIQFAFNPKAIAQHFRDTIVSYQSGTILIPNNNARAGIYEVAVSPMFRGQLIETQTHPFTLLYPSSVLDQHWDDFIGVLTHNYNGGYDFVGFQWYKNNEPIIGENHSYIYQPLEMGATYSAMLEEQDGTKLMTCEIIAKPQAEISIYPTLLQPQQIIRLHSSEDVTIWMYDYLGKMIYANSFNQGDHQFAAPHITGVYIIKITQNTSSGKTETKKLIVR